MSVLKAINHPNPSLEAGSDYVLRPGKIKLAAGINCRAETYYEECCVTQSFYAKTDGREYYHFVRSYPAGEVTPEEAIADTREWVMRNPDLHGFEILLACHEERGKHVHVHILINSVCATDGHKLHINKQRYRDVWLPLNRQIDIDHGRMVTERKQKEVEEVRTEEKRKWEVIKRKGEDSDIGHTYRVVSAAIETASNWSEFERLLNENDVLLEHKEGRKHIVFSYRGHRFRDTNLSKTFSDEISEERIEREFSKRGLEYDIERQNIEIDREIETIAAEIDGILSGSSRDRKAAPQRPSRQARSRTRTR
jgi:hypothetical protein